MSILGTGLWLGEGDEQRLADSPAGRPVAAVEPAEAAPAVTEVLLSTARAAAGMKQQELADLIGVTQPTLSLWERGRATIPADRVAALTYRLGLPKGSIAARQPLAPPKLARAHAARCGTYSGAIRHVQRGEKACAQCAKARREYHASRYVPSPRVPAECETDTAYKAHRARGEEACVACRVAHAAYERARKAAAWAAWNGTRNADLPRLRALLPLVVTRPNGPRNVLIERADGSMDVRGFRGLRKPPQDAP